MYVPFFGQPWTMSAAYLGIVLVLALVSGSQAQPTTAVKLFEESSAHKEDDVTKGAL